MTAARRRNHRSAKTAGTRFERQVADYLAEHIDDRVDLAGWAAEAEVERGNDDAVAAVIVHKRHGVAAPGQQWITCTVDDLIALLTGQRPNPDPEVSA